VSETMSEYDEIEVVYTYRVNPYFIYIMTRIREYINMLRIMCISSKKSKYFSVNRFLS